MRLHCPVDREGAGSQIVEEAWFCEARERRGRYRDEEGGEEEDASQAKTKGGSSGGGIAVSTFFSTSFGLFVKAYKSIL